MTSGARKMAGRLWTVVFYVFVFVAGMALVAGGTVLANFATGVLQNDAWQSIVGIALMVAGVAAFVGGAILLYCITYIPVPGQRHAENTRTGEYLGYTDTHVGDYGGHGHHHGGGYDGGGGN